MKLENLTIGQFIKCKTISEFETRLDACRKPNLDKIV